jgi:hypothetical protein
MNIGKDRETGLASHNLGLLLYQIFILVVTKGYDVS